MSHTNLVVGLLVAALTPSLSAQGITFVEGPSLAALDVRVIDENQVTNPSQLVLQGIEIMPIEITGRVASMELQTDVARLDERNGLPRIELPAACRLFHYRRLGGQFWGFLLVPDNGIATVVFELPGIGIGGAESPLGDRVAVSSSGRHLVAPVFGGGLWVVRLDGGVFASTNQPSRFVTVPVVIDSLSVMTGSTHAFFTGDDRMWRLPLADGGTPTDVTPSIVAQRPRIKDELAMSGDGNKVVFLYGPNNDNMRLYMLGNTGPATLLSPPPSKYEEPGYLPDGEGHSRLILNADGSRLFYVDSSIRDESFLLDTTSALPPLQITQDAIFQPYIGIHILPTFRDQKLIVAIGDQDLMDWYTAELTPTGGTVSNLTGTGSMTQPYPSGTLIPTKVTFAGATAIATTDDGATQTLRTIDLQSQNSNVTYQDLIDAPVAGNSTLPIADLYVPGPGDRIHNGLSGSLIGATPPGFHISPPLTSPLFGMTAITLLPNWGLMAFYGSNGNILALDFLTLDFRQAVITHQNGLVLSSGTEARYLSIGQPTHVILGAPPAVRLFISGAGG